MSKMKFVGPVLAHGDDMHCGMLADGRQIFVYDGTYLGAPSRLRRNPEYWYRRWATGEFEKPEDVPSVYVRKADGEYPAHQWQDDRPPVPPEQAYLTYLEAQRRGGRRWELLGVFSGKRGNAAVSH